MKKLAAGALLALLATTAAAAAPVARTFGDQGPVTYTVRLSANDLALTDDLTLTEDLTVQPGSSAQLPPLDPASLQGLTVERSDVTHETVGAQTVTHRRSVLEPARVGEVALRPRWVFVTGPDGAERALTVPRIALTVHAPTAAAAALPAGAGLLRPPEARRWPWALGAAALLGVLGVWVLRRLWLRARPPVPPWTAAKGELAKLEAAGHLGRGDVALYMEGLDRIFRRYLAARFGLPTRTLTTVELLEAARRHPVLGQLEEHYAPLQEVVDVVRFGGGQPFLAQAGAASEGIAALVAATTPRETTDDDAASDDAETPTPAREPRLALAREEARP